jgi:galactose-1-phosphate uridylyltransferase
MTRGFAFLAYPAEYRSSGVMTFIVGQDGVVYQKNLGSRTEEIAKALRQYDPDPTWRKAE